MKKITNYVTAFITSIILLVVGCATINALSSAQIAKIGSVVTQVADQGAVYAIHQGVDNALYFKAANTVIDNFANGTDLSPTALQAALAKVSGTNQWVGLAIAAVVTAYDYSYSTYISGQLTNAPAAKVWLLAAETGFKQALASTGTGLKLQVAVPPDFIVNGKVSKTVIKAKIKAALKK